jgi:hypothetical protein
MKRTIVKRMLIAGLLVMVLAPIAGCYPYWRYHNGNRDGYQRSDGSDWQRDHNHQQIAA